MTKLLLTMASVIQRWPLAIVGGTLAIALGLSFGIPRIEFRTGQETLLDPDSKIARDNTRFQGQFGGDPMLVLFETPGSGPSILQLFTPENRAALAALERELRETGNYHSIITPLLIVEFAMARIEQRMITQPAQLAEDQARAADEGRREAAARGASAEEQEAAAEAARQRVADAFNAEFGADARRFVEVGERSLDNAKFVEFILYGADGEIRPELRGLFPDEHHALMVVRMRGNLSIDEGSRVAADVGKFAEAQTFDGVTARISGPPLLIKEINDKMREALVIMAILAVAIMVVVLFTVFRARWRLLSLPAVLVGCVSAFGLMGFAGIPLTMVTISGLPILIGLGVDFAIQIHSRIEEETQASGAAETGLDRTFVRLGPALGIAAVAACIGFLVLHLSDVPMIRDFGSMLAVGSVIVFLTSVALIASIVYLRERVRLGEREAVGVRFEVEQLVGGITGRTVGRLAPIALVAVFVALVGLYAGRQIPTQTDPERFVPSDSSVLRELHYVRDVTGSTSQLSLLVETDDASGGSGGASRITDDEVIAWLGEFVRRQHERHPEIKQSNSIASFTESVTGEAPTAEGAEQALSVAPAALRDSVVNDDLTMGAVTFAITGDDTLTEREAMTDAIIADANPPPGVSVAPAGIAVVGAETVRAVSANRDLMSFVAIVAIFGVLLVSFRNVAKAVAPLLPVVLALGASAMFLYVIGIEYSPLTSISGPLIIAMGTEFNVLLMARYFEERGAGLRPREAMSKASLRIGRAITASGLTVMGGFAVLALSDFPLLVNFGQVTALNIGLSLLSTLVLLPPLLVWADEDRGMVGAPAEPALER